MKFSDDKILQTAAGASIYVLTTRQTRGVVRNCRRVGTYQRRAACSEHGLTGCVLSVAVSRISFDRLPSFRSVFPGVRYHSIALVIVQR